MYKKCLFPIITHQAHSVFVPVIMCSISSLCKLGSGTFVGSFFFSHYCTLYLIGNFLVTNFLLQDVTVIFRRRGGNDLEQNHSKWVETVKLAPDIINMTFTPIVSLLKGVPGVNHLTRAIDLYLECKF